MVKFPFARLMPLPFVMGLAISSPASPVRYSFVGDTTDAFGFPSWHQTFVYTAPDFISSTVTVPVSALDSFSTTFEAITSIRFIVGTNITSGLNITINQTDSAANYRWDLGTFTTPGTYPTVPITNVYNKGTLTVAPVPEPTSILALSVGAIVVGKSRKKWRSMGIAGQ